MGLAIRLVIVFWLLSGCGSEIIEKQAIQLKYPAPDLSGNTYIVGGQSNAVRCDWSYFEKTTKARIINIAKEAHDIDLLISSYDHPELDNVIAKSIIFVHGESDAVHHTAPDYYVERVEYFRQIVSDQIGVNLPLLISTVGYSAEYPDDHFNIIRVSVKTTKYNNWMVAYDLAQYYRDWGWLLDGIHFTENGCKSMMNGIIDYISVTPT